MTFLAKLNPDRPWTLGLDFGSDFNLARFKEFVKANAGKQVRIELPVTKRSNTQNNYYWVYLQVIERETGNNANDLHDYFKERLLPKKTITIKGRKGTHQIETPMSTTELDKIQFGEYLDKICAMTNVPLPDPEAAGYMPK